MFTNAITTSPESKALIGTLVQLGRDLGLKTLAAGAETTEEMDHLRAESVARPLDPDTLETNHAGRPCQAIEPTGTRLALEGVVVLPIGSPNLRVGPFMPLSLTSPRLVCGQSQTNFGVAKGACIASVDSLTQLHSGRILQSLSRPLSVRTERRNHDPRVRRYQAWDTDPSR